MKSLEKHYILPYCISGSADVSITSPGFQGYVKPEAQIYFKGKLKTFVIIEAGLFIIKQKKETKIYDDLLH